VTATTNAFAIQCGAVVVAFGQTSGAAASFTLDPNVNLPSGTQCSVMVVAAQVSDIDGNDPVHPVADHSFSFTTGTPPATNVMINELDADTPGSDAAEFVELYDGGVGNTPLTGLTVVFYKGEDDTVYAAFDLDNYSRCERLLLSATLECRVSILSSCPASLVPCRTVRTLSRSSSAMHRATRLARR
jgi:hypothetical protein